ncbi:unnamed protein product [marine sediment metagenome]|uniref:Uncharacterized protein n=1 Tax=marine sediment metagenome TaxID=412755 RepID=X1UMV6_9ZZZZ
MGARDSPEQQTIGEGGGGEKRLRIRFSASSLAQDGSEGGK